MASTHRPLSRYIRVVSNESGELSHDMNFGVEASDARLLSTFEGEWRRHSIDAEIPGEAPMSALGLRGPQFAVVEVDSFGTPIQAEPHVAEVVGTLEDSWPPERFDDRTMSMLSEQSTAFTAALVNRISEDGASDPSVYHILPWRLVDSLVHSLISATSTETGVVTLDTTARVSPYFSSAVPGLVGALEQLASATAGDAEIRSTAISSLLTALRERDVRRIPSSTQSRLAGLLNAIARTDPAHEEAARFYSLLLEALVDPDAADGP